MLKRFSEPSKRSDRAWLSSMSTAEEWRVLCGALGEKETMGGEAASEMKAGGGERKGFRVPMVGEKGINKWSDSAQKAT